jgi:multiple antibiotic resistance protein
MSYVLLAFASLFSVINPIGAAPIFVSMTRDVTDLERRRAAIRACIAAAITLLAFMGAGGVIFAVFGITVPAFQIAGGMLFTIFALRTLQVGGGGDEEERAPGGDPSVVPLGIPTIAGPGAISAVMVLVGQAQGHKDQLLLVVAVLVNIALTLGLLLAAPRVVARIGATGRSIVTKIMGLMTAAIGVQFVINGLRTVALDVLNDVLKGAGG